MFLENQQTIRLNSTTNKAKCIQMEMSNNKGYITEYDLAYLVQSRDSTPTTLQIALKTCPTFNIFSTACVSYRSKFVLNMFVNE